MLLAERTVVLSRDPLNPVSNFDCALGYEAEDQLAAALSFYLRAAEFGSDDVAYAALMGVARCLDRMGCRDASVKHTLEQAIDYMPDRPEAWWKLSVWHDRRSEWADAFRCAESGLVVCGKPALPGVAEFPGEFALLFQKAISWWWLGGEQESKNMLYELLKSHMLDPTHRAAVQANLERLGMPVDDEGVHPLEPVVMFYRKHCGANAPVIVDIGTRDGDDAFWLQQQLNGQKVYAIDAHPDAAEETRRRYPWMTVWNGAVSNFVGFDSFQMVRSENPNDAGCSSLYAEKVATWPQFDGLVEQITVPVITMEQFIEDHDIDDTIDVVKIDVEGYSYEVLEGFGTYLSRVKVLHVETEREATHPAHKNNHEVADFLTRHGFKLVDRSYEWGFGIEDQVWVNPLYAFKNWEVWR